MKNAKVEAAKNSVAGKIFLAYDERMQLCNVKRSGVDLTGVNDPGWLRPKDEPFVPFFTNREQSDAEHCFGMITLIYLISRFYPEIVGPSEFFNYISGAINHELGEIPTGDIPDDGSRNNELKDASEKAYIKQSLEATYGEDGAKADFILFLQLVSRGTDFGMTLYLFDKFEAVLRNLSFEKEGRPGSLIYKCKHTGLGLKDSGDIDITNTDSIADNWLCGLLLNDDVRKFKFTKYFVGIVQAASLIVRGHRMAWIDEKFPDFFGL